MKKKEKSEQNLLEDINLKLNLLILLTSLQGKDKKEKVKILKHSQGSFSKRELERITGIDRRDF